MKKLIIGLVLLVSLSVNAGSVWLDWTWPPQDTNIVDIGAILEKCEPFTNGYAIYHPAETNYTGVVTNQDWTVEYVTNSCWRGYVQPPIGKLTFVTHCDPYWTTNYSTSFDNWQYVAYVWGVDSYLVSTFPMPTNISPYTVFRINMVNKQHLPMNPVTNLAIHIKP